MKLAVVTFKSYHGFSTESIKELFTEVQSVHDRDTRQSRQYYVPFTRKEILESHLNTEQQNYGIISLIVFKSTVLWHVKSYLTNNVGLDMLDSCLL